MDEMTLTLNSPITEEQWDAITDVDFEHTNEITFYTKHSKEVKFVKASAQPKVIPCKDCKYAEVADPEDSQDGYTCQFHRGSIWFSGSYCSWAERREEPREN